ncbi:DUF4870 domain-containing protein [Chiayiivirga sp.]|jgi:uncharacterized Tic20 family protein|uniref:DUF4870 domain-containing protein n=1 Tax=Chiayiivirga sp. TaxID=2041042 RepID=UPI0031F30D0F
MNDPLENPSPDPTPQPPSPPPAAAQLDALAQGTPSAEERQWALFTHLSALVGFFIPFGNLLAPLIFWQVKKNEMPFIDDQGKEALNFQITVAIAAVVSFILMFVLIGFLLIFVVGLAWLVLTIVGAIKANNGEYYRYPMTLRLIK